MVKENRFEMVRFDLKRPNRYTMIDGNLIRVFE